jgi:hypothetical protein
LRTSPVAALKPTTPLTDDSRVRRIRSRWLILGLTLGLVGSWVGQIPMDNVPLTAVSSVVLIVFTLLALREALRGSVSRTGTWLSKRSRPWAIAAGDSLGAHPRRGLAPAILLGFAMLWISIGETVTRFNGVETLATLPSNARYERVPVWGMMGMLTVILIAIQVIAIGITLIGRRASAKEATTRMALGLSRDDAQRASFAEYLAPQALAVSSTALAGLVFGSIVHFTFDTSEIVGSVADYLAASGFAFLTILVMAAYCLVFSVLAGLVVVATTPSGTPVETLHSES